MCDRRFVVHFKVVNVGHLQASVFLGLIVVATASHGEGVTVERNVSYANYGQRTLKLDLFLPDADGLRTGVVLVHGGGWTQGNREKFTSMAEALSKRGLVVANISYRLATEAKFPAAVSDVKAATRWLRANAKKYRVDPKRIVGIGGSAGGHLVAMAGLTSGEYEGDGGSNDFSSELSAIVVMGSGVDQVSRVKESKTGEIENCTIFFGGTIKEVPQVYHDASPINHVSPQTPPILFLDGSLDRPGERYVDMRKQLAALDLPNQLQVIVGAKHGHWNRDEFRGRYVNAMATFIEEVHR